MKADDYEKSLSKILFLRFKFLQVYCIIYQIQFQKMNVKQYLHRIDLDQIPFPDLASLFLLQKNHLLNIPFENLDILMGRKIILDEKKMFKKVITNKRGGFCHELNGLFFLLLEKLGYKVKRISAQVYGSKKVFGKPYDHTAIIVELDKVEYLVDVGFGKFAFQPLRFDLEAVQSDGYNSFRIKKLNHRFHVVEFKFDKKDWQYGYKFTKKHREVSEYIPMCDWLQTSPDSSFTQRKRITIPTKNGGRITLADEVLKISKGKKVTEKVVKNEKEFNQYLEKYFGIKF